MLSALIIIRAYNTHTLSYTLGSLLFSLIPQSENTDRKQSLLNNVGYQCHTHHHTAPGLFVHVTSLNKWILLSPGAWGRPSKWFCIQLHRDHTVHLQCNPQRSTSKGELVYKSKKSSSWDKHVCEYQLHAPRTDNYLVWISPVPLPPTYEMVQWKWVWAMSDKAWTATPWSWGISRVHISTVTVHNKAHCQCVTHSILHNFSILSL